MRARRRNERGAVLVELAMVVPLLVALLLGVVDFAVMYSEKIDLRQGVREASWNGSRTIFGSRQPCPLTGFTGSGFGSADTNTQRVMCMAKRRADLDPATMRTKVVIFDLDTDATFTSGDPAGYFVAGHGILVCSMRPTRSTTRFYAGLLDGGVQRSRLSNVILRNNDGGAPPTPTPVASAQESPLPGHDWTWCDPALPPPE